MLVAGDWLQLPAVAAKSIFRNPFLKDYSAPERSIRDMFWRLDETIPGDATQLFELTQQVRSHDEWLIAVLTADREGQETWEMYCFTHGLPTRHVGSWLPAGNGSQVRAGSCRMRPGRNCSDAGVIGISDRAESARCVPTTAGDAPVS